jgi:hypothetical protein
MPYQEGDCTVELQPRDIDDAIDEVLLNPFI